MLKRRKRFLAILFSETDVEKFSPGGTLNKRDSDNAFYLFLQIGSATY
jgi:hypothetical protein